MKGDLQLNVSFIPPVTALVMHQNYVGVVVVWMPNFIIVYERHHTLSLIQNHEKMF